AAGGRLQADAAIRRATVKPAPAIAPPPATAAHPTGGRSRPRLSLVASNETPRMPAGLPATYPNTIPRKIGEVMARESRPPLMAMPALARANRGRITSLGHW